MMLSVRSRTAAGKALGKVRRVGESVRLASPLLTMVRSRPERGRRHSTTADRENHGAMAQSLFRRATRYTGAENRLTEILAAALERLPDVARDLALIWTAPSNVSAGEMAWPSTHAIHQALPTLGLQSVRTQQATVSGKLVDLALRFGPTRHPSPDDVVIWVESKLGADPHDQQVASYVADLPSNVRAASVVVLAPRSSLPYLPVDVPDGVPQRSWQATGRRLRAAAQDAAPVKAFLLKELIDYMSEDSLIDPHAIGPELLVALAHAEQAEAALVRVCEEISRHVASDHGASADSFAEASRTRKPDFGWNYWEAWNLRKNDAGEATLWLDWNARADATHSAAEGRSVIFISGLTAASYEELAATPEDLAVQDALLSGVPVDGRLVRFERVSDECERLTRVAFPEEVLIGRTLEDQAAAAGTWIVEGFRAIALARANAKQEL